MKSRTVILVLTGIMVVLWPLLTVWIGDYWISSVKSHPYYIYEESAPRVTRTILSAFPFIVLFVFANGKLQAAGRQTIAGVLSAMLLVTGAAICMYGLFLYHILTHQTRGSAVSSGAVMMLTPIFLILLVFVGDILGRKLFPGE